MPAPALLLALALMASDPTPANTVPVGEPLPAGAPTEDYPLTAWCYGAMSEYLDIYERVKPDLKAIDKMFGSSQPDEPEPYSADMAAARDELKVLAGAVQTAEQASPNPIAPQGAEAIKLGRSIWSPAETKTHRELARAWLSWALPDRCDTTARSLTTKSALLGQALKYNTTPPPEPAASAPDQAPASGSPSPTPPPPPVITTPPPTPPASAPPEPEASAPDQAPASENASPAPPPPAPVIAAPPPAPPADAPPTASPPAAIPQLDPNGPVPDSTTPDTTPRA